MRIIRAPRGWSPQSVLARKYPAIVELARSAEPTIRRLEAHLDHDEAAGRNTTRPRQALGELKWRLQYTGDTAAAAQALARVRAETGAPAPPAGAAGDRDGCVGFATEVWFLQLDAVVDRMLADDPDPAIAPEYLLDRINHPRRLARYLDSLRVSHVAEDGVDRRKELNLATANLVRLVLRRRPAGYLWDPRLEAVVRRFVAEWQDAATGFFGADYELDGELRRTVDLSLTFHMARYLGGGIAYWPQLIDTLLEIRDDRYPNGWLDEEGMTSHNNYDIAVLFGLGWRHMCADQHRRAQRELERMLRWCLDRAIAADGAVVARAVGESLPESYYFTVAFLDAVGFFDAKKRFWSDCGFPEAAALRRHLEHRVCALHRSHPMVGMTLDRLRG